MVRSIAWAVLVAAGAANAQDPPSAAGLEFGARYWISSSRTERSHNAQSVAPELGNPTSVLVYEDLDAHALELHARKTLGALWFVRGNAGVGTIRKGTFDDEDFRAGQVKETDTQSSVKGNRLGYFTVDLGRQVWTQGASSVALFAGYQFWRERIDAYGVVFTLHPTVPPNQLNQLTVGDTVPSVSNEVTWHSLRLGVAGDVRFDSATRLVMEFAWVPYARVRDEDSHWLRTAPDDLGPAPNILIEGRGRGLQVDVELRHGFSQRWEAGLGFRHWFLRSTNGERVVRGLVLPITQLESMRTGFIFSLTRRW